MHYHIMDRNIQNDYRPVLNITSFSKVVEREIVFHLNKYLINTNLSESLDSTYKIEHSTEANLGRMKKAIMGQLNKVAQYYTFFCQI